MRPVLHHVQIREGTDLHLILLCANVIVKIRRQHSTGVTGVIVDPAGECHGGKMKTSKRQFTTQTSSEGKNSSRRANLCEPKAINARTKTNTKQQ